MKQSEQEEFLEIHIPYRLRAVELLRVVSEWRLAGVNPRRVDILFDGSPALSGSIGLIHNPFLEVGLMFGRVLLEFLGIKLSMKGQLVARQGRQDTDVVIEDIDGLQSISPEALKDVPLAPGDAVRRSIEMLIATSHKGVAHLTSDPAHSPTLQELHLGSQVVPWLVCEHVYKKKGRAIPNYRLAV